MYSTKQICDRLSISEEKLDQNIELIEDAGYKCICIFDDGIKYYRPYVVGWLLQLVEQLKSEKVQDFVAQDVDEDAIADFMANEVELSQVTKMEGQTENLLPVASEILPTQDLSAIATQVQAYLNPLQQKEERLKIRFALQEKLVEAIDKGYQLSSEDIFDITGRKPSAKVKDIWVHGIYGFTYLGRSQWKAWYVD